MFEVVGIQDDFRGWNSWFDITYRANLRERWATMRVALNLLNQFDRSVNILETGCIRQEHDWGGGMSTLVFADYLQRYGGKLTTIDISPVNMTVCKKVTQAYSNQINYVINDSLAELERMASEDELQIDLLYLDSLDCPLDDSSAWPSQEHTLKEFRLAEPMLHERSILLMDDVGFENGGKGAILNKMLPDFGWTNLMNHQQSLWIKKL